MMSSLSDVCPETATTTSCHEEPPWALATTDGLFGSALARWCRDFAVPEMGRLDELKKFYRDLNENMKTLSKEQDKALHQIMIDKSKPKMSKLDMGK